ncbi:unnamed protein product, partial [Vitis vinifera]
MGGATRFLMLLATPFPILHPRPSLLHLARRSVLSLSPHLYLSATSRRRLRFSITASDHLHTHAAAAASTRDDYLGDPFVSSPNSSRTWHPWPEWSRLVESLNAGGDIARAPSDDDAFVESEGLPDEFVRAAIACLGFGRNNPNALGSLSRKAIEVVVENGSPFLFTNGFDSVRRLRAFLAGGESNVMESEKARTVDLMRFLLSYASNPTNSSGRNDSYNRELVESSVRNLLNELAEMSCRVPASDLSGSVQKHFSDRYGQTPRPLGQNIEMKRGDWLCPRCSFMNFARNMKCLECEEARPKRQLTGGEWECPQCDFFNYGRNATCLRCDCKRPGEASFGSTNSRSGVGYGNGVNRFVVSTRKTPLERRLANAQNRRNLGNDGTPEGDFQSGGSNKTLDTSVSKSLDEILGRSSAETILVMLLLFHYLQICLLISLKIRRKIPVSQAESKVEDKEQAEKSERWFKKVAELHDVTDLSSAISDEDFPEIMPMRKGENRFVVSKKKDRSLTSPTYKRRLAMDQASKTNFVPFVPFPPDYFAKKDKQQPNEADSTQKVTDNMTNLNESSPGLPKNQNVRQGWTGKSLEGSAVKEPDPLDMSEEAKAERWFRRVAQIKDISELSQIPDEDFPSIMPMRKGVNRFVVSKRKTPLERRLTSPQYRRNLPVVSSEPVKKENESG